jgi:ribosomal-protein-alanine N-acetyltransferase
MDIMKLVDITLGENYHPSFYQNLHNFWPEGFIVATSNEKMVGFILATISDSRTARILMLSVYPVYQRRGIASSLLNAIIKQCLTRNIKIIQLEVRTHNQNAIRFYLRHKFIVYKTLFNYYKNNDNAYLMYRYL